MGNKFIVSSILKIQKRNPLKTNDASSVSVSNEKRLISQPSKFTSIQDQRRIVFISLIGLYRSWKDVPTQQMDTAIILMPLRRKWFYQPLRYRSQLKSCFVSQITLFSDLSKTQQFIQLLKRKDKQGLVVWIMDYFDKHDYPMYPSVPDCIDLKPSVAVFWHHLSQILITLHDPVSGNTYQPLHLKADWWETHYKEKDDHYNVKLSSILTELYFLTMKYRTMQEIIYQSNPHSLHPVVCYGDDAYGMVSTTKNDLLHMYGTESVNEMGAVDWNEDNHEMNRSWFISDAYDPEII